MSVEETRTKKAMTNAERTRKCRARRSVADNQVALAVARLVHGGHPGDAARSLADWLDRAAVRAEGEDSGDLDQLDELRTAAEKLRRVRPRY